MSLLLKNVSVGFSDSSLKNKSTNVLIKNGIIAEIGSGFTGDKELDLTGCYLAPGFMDLWSHFCEPGFEHKEDIHSGLSVAMAGGYTDVCLLPNTEPIIDSKSQLNFIQKASSSSPIQLHVYASVSQKGKDEVIAEFKDLHEHGAIGFTGGLHPISNSELLLKALQYSQSFGGLVLNRPNDNNLSRYGQMHESVISTQLGMKGIPVVAEKIAVERDLSILAYAGGRLHLSGISSRIAIEKIRKAKSEGLAVTCDVPIHNLVFTDQDLMAFDSNLKMDPPLREKSDQEALVQGLLDGTIDAISSFHIPQDTESKELEFDLSEFGSISLQTVLSQALTLTDNIPLEILLNKLSNGPRKVLGLPAIKLEKGEIARYTIIDPRKSWVFDSSSNRSKSSNSVLLGRHLVGKAMGVVIGDQWHEC